MSTPYRVPVLEQFEYQQAIITRTLSAPPGSPSKGDRYIVGASPTGAWASHANHIAWYDGAAWRFDVPLAGWQLWATDEAKQYTFDGTVWAYAHADMTKAVYDTNNNGIVDKAETVDDGAGNASTAAQVKNAVTKAHTQGTDQGLDTGGANATTAAQVKTAVTQSHVQGTDQGLDTGGANATTAAQVKSAVTKAHVQGTDQGLDTGGANATTAAQVKTAVTNSHVQGTDQGLDTGGANAITVAQVKESYDKRGTYDSGLKVIVFNL